MPTKRTYGPKDLTCRHKAILRAIHLGEPHGRISRRFDISLAQIGRVRRSEAGTEYLAGLEKESWRIVVELAAALPAMERLVKLGQSM